ncbi:SIMPL domain-containing protein [Seohaeicola saemankumensis]|uniref:SIMPL domain-containing protein n=1 Tax=Seohaeicola TaxID=481178 RepID=UPI0035CEC5E1
MRRIAKPMILTGGALAALLLAPLHGGSVGEMRPAWTGAAMAQGAGLAEASRTLSIGGTGRVDLAPDMAMVRIGVTHQDRVAATALRMTSDAVAAMLARLEGLGVAARDMQTAGLSLNPVWRDRSGQQGQPAPWGFEASNIVSLRLRDLDALGPVLDALVTDGANRLDGVSFGLQDPDSAMDEARRLAVADARRKAALFAEAAGVRLGPVISLSETGGGMPRPQMMEMAAMRSDAVPIAAGEVGVSASVQMVFALE